MSEEINRVKCVVDSCTYYQDGNRCVAQMIEIQPPGANDKQETDCATFTPKNQQQ